ncbi:MAG: hypothetical protein WCI77_00110 [Candidatus Omnitrophota bacterium]
MVNRRMYRAVLLIVLVSLDVCAGPAWPQEAIIIAQTAIPVIENARCIQNQGKVSADTHIATYRVNKNFTQVVEFYKDFFAAGGFSTMIEQSKDIFNMSVKKENVMFTMRIYPEGKQVAVQFIW